MEMVKKIVRIEADVEIEIPFEIEDDVLGAYQAVIDADGEVDDIYKHIAFNVVVNGQEDFVEGVGRINGKSSIKATFDRDVLYDIDDVS